MDQGKRAVALGFFDGVHRGHAALLECVKQRASELQAEATVLTFDVHPDTLVFGKEVPLINSAPEREEIIRRLYGIEHTVFLHFNRSMMTMPWQDFLSSAVDELKIAAVVVGHDFSFGYRGEGKPDRLQAWCRERGIACDVIPAVCVDGRVVSSTEIRRLIADGAIEEANRLLGHPHTLSDVVGVRPTVSEGERVSVESHLLDFQGNLYGRHARVEFCHFQRAEHRFESMDELSEQIRLDTLAARAWFTEQA